MAPTSAHLRQPQCLEALRSDGRGHLRSLKFTELCAALGHPTAAGPVDAIIGGGALVLGAKGVGWLYKAIRPMLIRSGMLKAGAAAEGGLLGDAGAIAGSAFGSGLSAVVQSTGQAIASAGSAIARLGPNIVQLAARGFTKAAEAIVALVTVIAGLPAWAIAAITVGLVGLGAGICEVWKHWDSSKGLIGNLKTDLGGLTDFIIEKAQDVGRAAGSLKGIAPPPGKAPIVLHHTTTLHGDVIAKSVTHYLADAMDRHAHAGGGAFDPGMALSPVGLGYA